MAATVKIYQWNGASPGTSTDKTGGTIRVATDDVSYSTGASTNPIPIPASSNNYSYWCSLRLYCTVAPVTSVSNLKFYSDGTNSSPSGVLWKAQTANVGAAAGYREAVGTPGTTGTLLNTTNHTGLTGAPVNLFTFDSGSPLTVTGSTATTGAFGDFVVFQITVPSTVTGTAAITGEVFTFAYDES